jgi:corrinoid protein of di/trimethylamine methyltransferase
VQITGSGKEENMSIEVIENLKKAILEYDAEAAAKWAAEAVQQKVDPNEALKAMTEAIREIGDGFGAGDLFLPDLVGAADAMSAATPIIDQEIARVGSKKESLGSAVIGTVYGDIHTIGKTMVATLLTAEGFTVEDLGINVTAEQFVEGVRKYQPDILAMSALMTMTAPEQKKVIETLKNQGLRDRVKIMVGGGAITQEFADSIGADGYEPTAPGAAKLARRLVTQ